MEQLEYKQFGFEVVELTETNDSWIVKGWAATYTEDRERDQFHPGAFWRSVRKRHDEMMLSRGVSGVKFLFAHKQDVIIGTPLVMREDVSKGLWVEAEFLKDEDFPEARRCWKLAKLKLLDAFSVGYTVVKAEPMVKVKGKKRDIYEADILEFSLLSIPMNETATVEEVKSLDSETIVEYTPEEPEMTELEMKALSDLIVAAVKEAAREAVSEALASAPEVETKETEAVAEVPEVAVEPVVEEKAAEETPAEEPIVEHVVDVSVDEANLALAAKSANEIMEVKAMISELIKWKNAQSVVEEKAVELEIPETDNLVEEKGYLASLRELQAIFCEGNTK